MKEHGGKERHNWKPIEAAGQGGNDFGRTHRQIAKDNSRTPQPAIPIPQIDNNVEQNERPSQDGNGFLSLFYALHSAR